MPNFFNYQTKQISNNRHTLIRFLNTQLTESKDFDKTHVKLNFFNQIVKLQHNILNPLDLITFENPKIEWEANNTGFVIPVKFKKITKKNYLFFNHIEAPIWFHTVNLFVKAQQYQSKLNVTAVNWPNRIKSKNKSYLYRKWWLKNKTFSWSNLDSFRKPFKNFALKLVVRELFVYWNSLTMKKLPVHTNQTVAYLNTTRLIFLQPGLLRKKIKKASWVFNKITTKIFLSTNFKSNNLIQKYLNKLLQIFLLKPISSRNVNKKMFKPFKKHNNLTSFRLSYLNYFINKKNYFINKSFAPHLSKTFCHVNVNPNLYSGLVDSNSTYISSTIKTLSKRNKFWKHFNKRRSTLKYWSEFFFRNSIWLKKIKSPQVNVVSQNFLLNHLLFQYQTNILTRLNYTKLFNLFDMSFFTKIQKVKFTITTNPIFNSLSFFNPTTPKTSYKLCLPNQVFKPSITFLKYLFNTQLTKVFANNLSQNKSLLFHVLNFKSIHSYHYTFSSINQKENIDTYMYHDFSLTTPYHVYSEHKRRRLIYPWLQQLVVPRTLYPLQYFNMYRCFKLKSQTKRNKIYNIFKFRVNSIQQPQIHLRPGSGGGTKLFYLRVNLLKVILPMYGKLSYKQFKNIWKNFTYIKSCQSGRFENFLTKINTSLYFIIQSLNWAPNNLWARQIIKKGWIYKTNCFNSQPNISYNQLFPLSKNILPQGYNPKLDGSNRISPNQNIFEILKKNEIIQINPCAKQLVKIFFSRSTRWNKKVIPSYFDVNSTATAAILLKNSTLSTITSGSRMTKTYIRVLTH